METLLIAELDEDATEPWVQSKSDYGWTVDRGPGKSYVRWGENVFSCDRVLDREEECCEEEHWYAYRLESAGQEFYVAGGQALPSYEKVKLFRMTTDHSAYAFAGYRKGQWYVCHNGRELAAAEEVLHILVASAGSRFAFHLKNGAEEYVQEMERTGPRFERIKNLQISKEGQFLIYHGWCDGQERFVVNHQELNVADSKQVQEGIPHYRGQFSSSGNHWSCLIDYGKRNRTLVLDGGVVSRNAGGNRYNRSLISPYFSPDESSRAFPIKVETGEYALCHDGNLYKVQSLRFPVMIGWLPGNVIAWVTFYKNQGWLFRTANGPAVPTLIASAFNTFVGPQGGFACVGEPYGQDVEYPRILVKDGRVLQQADYFQTCYPGFDFGFSATGRLSYSYADFEGNWSFAIDGDTVVTGFESFNEFIWAPDGEQYACFGEKDFGRFLIVNSKLYGSFEDTYHADFSNDSRHWSGVVRANEKWIVLLDGEIIDQVDHFDYATPFRLFTEDNRWCHYFAIEDGKIVYKRVTVQKRFWKLQGLPPRY